MTRARSTFLRAAVLLFLTLAGAEGIAHSGHHINVVLRWNRALLQAVRDTRMPPPQVARSLAIVHTAMFDAWAALG